MQVTHEIIVNELAKERTRHAGLVAAVEQSAGRIDAYNRILQHLSAPETPGTGQAPAVLEGENMPEKQETLPEKGEDKPADAQTETAAE